MNEWGFTSTFPHAFVTLVGIIVTFYSNKKKIIVQRHILTFPLRQCQTVFLRHLTVVSMNSLFTVKQLVTFAATNGCGCVRLWQDDPPVDYDSCSVPFSGIKSVTARSHNCVEFCLSLCR